MSSGRHAYIGQSVGRLEDARLLTGSGRASKDQVQHVIKTELKLPAILEPNDVADASAVALCHLHSVKYCQPANKVDSVS